MPKDPVNELVRKSGSWRVDLALRRGGRRTAVPAVRGLRCCQRPLIIRIEGKKYPLGVRSSFICSSQGATFGTLWNCNWNHHLISYNNLLSVFKTQPAYTLAKLGIQ